MADMKEKGSAREMWAGGIGLAIAVVVSWGFSQFAGVDVPEYVTSAFGGIVMWAVHKIEEAGQ